MHRFVSTQITVSYIQTRNIPIGLYQCHCGLYNNDDAVRTIRRYMSVVQETVLYSYYTHFSIYMYF